MLSRTDLWFSTNQLRNVVPPLQGLTFIFRVPVLHAFIWIGLEHHAFDMRLHFTSLYYASCITTLTSDLLSHHITPCSITKNFLTSWTFLQSFLILVLSKETCLIVQSENILQHSTSLVLFLSPFVLSQLGDCIVLFGALPKFFSLLSSLVLYYPQLKHMTRSPYNFIKTKVRFNSSKILTARPNKCIILRFSISTFSCIFKFYKLMLKYTWSFSLSST